MPHVILGLLLAGPLSLYDLRKHFTAGLSLFYSASFGGIQRALRQLLDEGLITVDPEPGSPRGRKAYSVTPAGRERWRTWMLSAVPDTADAETVALARIYLLGRLPDRGDRAVALGQVRAQAEHSAAVLRRLAHEVDSAAESLAPGDREVFRYQRATLDYGERAHALLLTWVEELREDAS